METAVAVSLMIMGAGIAGVWTRDILAAEYVDLSHGVFSARDPDSGTLFWPHWLAEYATAAALVAAAIGLLADAGWARPLAAMASGALLYTSTNSLGWALSRRDRLAYAVPMVAGLVVGVVACIFLLADLG